MESWSDRLREAAYTSPSGERLTFGYENLKQITARKTTAFEFPDADGTFIQDLGTGGRRYPMRVFFWGSDCDLEAAAFGDALTEPGIGKLEHPVHGTIDVVPFGDITRRDDLKSAANQAVIEVTFWETTGLVYPSAQGDPASDVLASVDSYNDAAAVEFEETIGLDTEVEKATFKSRYTAALDTVDSGLQAVADTEAAVAAQFDAVYDSINNGIDTLVSDPLTLAFQTAILIQAPARALAAIGARLEAYGNLLSSLTGGPTLPATAQDFRTDDLFASTYVTGSVLSAVNNTFLTKTEALAAAEYILAQLAAAVAWRDANLVALDEIDTGAAYQKLLDSVAVAAGYLVEISFTLKQERRVVIDRPRTIIDLAAELLGAVDTELDFLISSNELTGSEILELPRGREIVYYV